MATIVPKPSKESRPPASSRATARLATIAIGLAVPAVAALAVAAGCSYAASDDGTPPGFHDGDTNDETDAILIEVYSDTTPPNPLCGTVTPSCPTDNFDPDAGPRTCTSVDGGADDTAPSPGDAGGDDSDAAFDTSGSGTRNGCRVVQVGDATVTACRPAGYGSLGNPCTQDADCSPGLACVGPPTFATCLAYCCTASATYDPCHEHKLGYCAALPLAERPQEKVPVCVVPETCKLLPSDPHDACSKDGTTTCIVVDSFGDTSCVPAGNLRDLACCSTDPDDKMLCDVGYACLGPVGDRVCRKLCKIGDACAGGHCEAQSSFPAGFGVCTVDVTDGASDGGHCGT